MTERITDAMVDAYLKEQKRVVFEADQMYGRDGCPAPEYLHPVRDACRAGLRAALGIDEEEAACANGNTLILEAIARKNTAILAAMQKRPVRLLTQVELDSIGSKAEGMDGQGWDIWVQQKFAEVNGLRYWKDES
jgi:hypothetical protein